jgi:hypothetical protein
MRRRVEPHDSGVMISDNTIDPAITAAYSHDTWKDSQVRHPIEHAVPHLLEFLHLLLQL